jgi:cap2 methyltransferase
LNEAKSKLDNIPPKDYGQLIKIMDLYASLKSRISKELGVKYVSNAFLKMYEILCSVKGFVPKKDKLLAFCDAEFPGSFICAIRHYMKTMKPKIDFDWVASSYMPELENNITGDIAFTDVNAAFADVNAAFADVNAAETNAADAFTNVNAANTTILGDQYGLFKDHREKWLMDGRNNGDLTVIENIIDLSAKVMKLGGADIYTSDAGIDVSGDYSKQEESTLRLNFGQILCGLLSLNVGGSFVTKQYTFFMRLNRQLIAIMVDLFEELSIVKPLTSRPANSEVYVIGINFKGIDDKLKDFLIKNFASFDLKLDISADESLLRISRQLFKKQQIAFLNELVLFYRHFKFNKLREILKDQTDNTQKEWLINNPIVKT